MGTRTRKYTVLSLSALTLVCLISFYCHADAADSQKDEAVESIAFEEVMPNEVGEWDLRLSVEARRKALEEEAVDKENLLTIPRLQAFFGIMDRLGGEVSVPYVHRKEGEESETGFGDISLGLKYLLVKEALAMPALVGIFELGIPTGDEEKGLGEGKTEFNAALGWVKRMGEHTVQGTFGYSTDDQDIEENVSYNASWAVPVGKGVHVYAEFLGERALKEGAHRLALGPGIKYNVTPRLFVALGAPVGLTEKADDYRIVSQVQVGF